MLLIMRKTRSNCRHSLVRNSKPVPNHNSRREAKLHL
ncbi:unnamed protein product [Larinioides sclopetarius]|uniref:Uncharacterized protein n=1 Tax=Larinioides sclopetarius TaxID=280406 RepID=A0AAV1ZEM3_9ARAC